MSTRPSRRAVRRPVIESDPSSAEEEEEKDQEEQEDEDDAYEPVVATPKKVSRKRGAPGTGDEKMTPARGPRGKRARAAAPSESVGPESGAEDKPPAKAARGGLKRGRGAAPSVSVEPESDNEEKPAARPAARRGRRIAAPKKVLNKRREKTPPPAPELPEEDGERTGQKDDDGNEDEDGDKTPRPNQQQPPQLTTPSRTPSVQQSRQTTPSRTMTPRKTLPEGTPKPKSQQPPQPAAAALKSFEESTGYTPSHPTAPAPVPRSPLVHPGFATPGKARALGFPAAPVLSPSRNRPLSSYPDGATAEYPASPSQFPSSPSQQIPTSAQMAPPMSQMMPHMSQQSQQQLQLESMEPKPRTVITHLVMTNFKSYAGRQEVGPFHPSFSSVVGPNGSGKSNVIDSLLFVFGFRASKMRQGKISALIHNSANHMDLQFCEVEVHFQEVIDLPNGEHEVVPDSRLVVARRAFKNNSSKYSINGRDSNFTEVTTLLRAKGIDLDHKRFLILQGEVESIAQMKPKAQNDSDDGLLEYLEDIIGTSKYKQPIEEAAQQVETLNEVCMEKSTRVQHVEKEKNSLEDKKNQALEFIKDENELTYKQAALYQVHILECSEHITVTSEMLTQLQTELEEEQTKHKGNEEGAKKLEKKYKDLVKENEAIERETQAVAKEQAKYDKENVKLQEKKKFLVSKEKKLQKAIATSRHQSSEATANIEKYTSDLERVSQEIASLEARLKGEEKELEKVVNDLKDKTQVFNDQITQKQKQLEPWNEKINAKQQAIAVAQSELDILHEKRNASQTALEEVHAKIALIQDSRKAKEAEFKECRAEKAKLEKEAQKLEAQVEKMTQVETNLKNLLSGARQKADEAKASLAASQNQGNVLTGLMRLKESGRIDGFHGRLGNLGTIDAKYDVAISTACPSLDNIVVDTVEVGQQCIDYLRKNNLGRARFICLDRLQARGLGPIQTPDNVPRLFDLVKPRDPKFAPAFYSVMTDTLVAKDLTQANKIAYGAKRWRVVTLDGQLIDKSGTMAGGGTRVARGKMSSKQIAETTREAVAKLEANRDAQESNYLVCQAELRGLQEKLRDLKETIPQLEVTMSKIQLEIQSGEKQVADAQKRVQELSVQHRPSAADDNRVAALEKQIITLTGEFNKLKGETAGIEEEIKNLQGKIMDVGGVKLRSQKAKVDGIREQIETLTEQHMQADIAKTKAEKTKVKVEKQFRDSTEELSGVNEEMAGVDEQVKAHTRAAEQFKARVEEAQEFLETKKEELNAVKEELDKKKAEINAMRAQEIEVKNKIEQHQKTLSDNQKRLHYWSEKLEKLALHQLTDLDEQVQGELELPQYTEDELRDMDKESLKSEIAVLEEKLANISVDLSVLQEYRRRVEEYTARTTDLNAAVETRDTAKHHLDDLRRRRLTEFMDGFSTISLRLKEMYQMITMGGNAELELVDSLDPFSEGILFSVMPPKKSWKNIGNLSGGEKTLSSLALVFALHHYKPTPLYVMDEIDAALDFRNVSIVASYIKERTRNAQFVVISLRNNMFELAKRLVGVYKVNHMTKSITIENRDYLNRDTERNNEQLRPQHPQNGKLAAGPLPQPPPPPLSQPLSTAAR